MALLNSLEDRASGLNHTDSSHPRNCAESLPLSVRIGQLLMPLTPNGSETKILLEKGLITGFAITGTLTQNNAIQIQKISKSNFRLGALIASDEEGGSVQRYRKIIWPLLSAKETAEVFTPEQAYDQYLNYGKKLKQWGVTVVFGPVVDVGFGPGIRNRSYSSDPTVVTNFARGAIQAYTDSGLFPVLKHFPGHGDTTNDTHADMSITKPLEKLRTKDLLPYTLLTQYKEIGVMVGHLIVPGSSNGLPSSMSKPIITRLLRTELGFQGVIFSDALGMGAVRKYHSDESTAQAFLSAGGTVLIVPSVKSALTVRRAIEKLVLTKNMDSSLITKAASKVLSLKGVNACSYEMKRERPQPR
jgi:beta-N-acetylhexosaminidase